MAIQLNGLHRCDWVGWFSFHNFKKRKEMPMVYYNHTTSYIFFDTDGFISTLFNVVFPQ